MYENVEKHKIVLKYSHFIAKNQNIMRFLFNNISFSLQMFAKNENRIPNILDKFLKNTISTCPEHPKIDWKMS